MNSICIFGVFVADLCFFGKKIPERGETILGNNHLVGPGGKGSNQAIAAARLEGKVNFITKVGKDNYADMAFSLYKEAGVNVESISLSSGKKLHFPDLSHRFLFSSPIPISISSGDIFKSPITMR